MMYDHIGLVSNRLDASIGFYQAVLASLGFELCCRDASGAGFGPKDAPAFWLYAGNGVSGAHIAFRATDHASVDAFYKAGLVAGGHDNGAPGLRPDYAPGYYAAFLLDPDGNNIEAVCLNQVK